MLVNELNAKSRGVWLVKEKNASHIFNLDKMIYIRVAGKKSKRYPGDGDPQIINTVALYPMVGHRFLIFTDDGEIPHLMEQWRLSDTIISIEEFNGQIQIN